MVPHPTAKTAPRNYTYLSDSADCRAHSHCHLLVAQRSLSLLVRFRRLRLDLLDGGKALGGLGFTLHTRLMWLGNGKTGELAFVDIDCYLRLQEPACTYGVTVHCLPSFLGLPSSPALPFSASSNGTLLKSVV
jgi:hypothetical protein